ncbi:MAG: methyltransferase domain-containing protein [Verrucomicrobia bacterium]|nr:methyltransferase domain-containing protein [Verrucomicrobiota bacterium]MBS0636515.1 methyltransferase domain-containing protein [Verrucomicrobiota bacterium]
MKTFLWVRYFNAKDLLRTIWRYWLKKPKFALVDLTVLLSYFFKSPYTIGRQYKDSEPYGETPLKTLDDIIARCPIKQDDVVYELGSGRGRACFWLALYKGFKTVGIEYIPQFVESAKRIQKLYNVENVQFRTQDILEADIQDASWIYLFGSALPDETIMALTERLEKLRPGTKIITISYPLTAYTKHDIIVVKETLEVEFAWGTTTAYIQSIE